MKAFFISFNQALYEDVIHLLENNSISGFTCWENVTGCGSKDGEPHLGTHAWPTMNSAIITFVENSLSDKLLNAIQALNNDSEDQGLRAFYWNIGGSVG